MRQGGGRAKGSRYERKVAKLLEAWWGTRISRTPLSGGWGNSAAFDTAGDLICQGGWPFVFELKCQEVKKGWHLEHLLYNEKCPINDWWKQACEASRGHKKRKMPVLIFSRNHVPNFLMIRKEEFHELSPDWTPLGSMFEIFLDSTSETVLIMLLSDFLENITPPKPSPNHKRGPLTRPQHKPHVTILGTKKKQEESR